MDQVKVMLAALRSNYLRDLPSHIDELEEILLELERDGFDLETCRDLYRQVHSLKGSGGTFGLSVSDGPNPGKRSRDLPYRPGQIQTRTRLRIDPPCRSPDNSSRRTSETSRKRGRSRLQQGGSDARGFALSRLRGYAGFRRHTVCSLRRLRGRLPDRVFEADLARWIGV